MTLPTGGEITTLARPARKGASAAELARGRPSAKIIATCTSRALLRTKNLGRVMILFLRIVPTCDDSKTTLRHPERERRISCDVDPSLRCFASLSMTGKDLGATLAAA